MWGKLDEDSIVAIWLVALWVFLVLGFTFIQVAGEVAKEWGKAGAKTEVGRE